MANDTEKAVPDNSPPNFLLRWIQDFGYSLKQAGIYLGLPETQVELFCESEYVPPHVLKLIALHNISYSLAKQSNKKSRWKKSLFGKEPPSPGEQSQEFYHTFNYFNSGRCVLSNEVKDFELNTKNIKTIPPTKV